MASLQPVPTHSSNITAGVGEFDPNRQLDQLLQCSVKLLSYMSHVLFATIL